MERANAYDAQSLSFMGVTTIGLSASGSGLTDEDCSGEHEHLEVVLIHSFSSLIECFVFE